MRQEIISILVEHRSLLPAEFSSNQAIGLVKDKISISRKYVPSTKQIGKILSTSPELGSRLLIKGKNKLVYFIL